MAVVPFKNKKHLALEDVIKRLRENCESVITASNYGRTTQYDKGIRDAATLVLNIIKESGVEDR